MKVMNFLIFREFFRFFYIFIKLNKKLILYHVLMWQLTWREQKGHGHVAAYGHATWRFVCVLACVCVHVWERVRACACVRLERLSILFRIALTL